MNNLLQGAQTIPGRTDLKKRQKSSEVFASQKSAMSLSNRPFFKYHEPVVSPHRVTVGKSPRVDS